MINQHSHLIKVSSLFILDAIEEATDEFGVKNGYVLKNVIRQMLQLDPLSRPTLSELSVSFT